MGLDDYVNQGESQQKQTHITLANPDHPEASGSYADDDTMRRHFRAANSVQDSPINRKMIVGDFLVALDEDLHEEDSDALVEFLESLIEEEE